MYMRHMCEGELSWKCLFYFWAAHIALLKHWILIWEC
jgi:hypothetical protein